MNNFYFYILLKTNFSFKVLHGEQFIEVYKSIPVSGVLEATLNVVDILDKRSGALLVVNGNCFSNNLLKMELNFSSLNES